jgi:hypothetical protein
MTNTNPRRDGVTAGAEAVDQFEQPEHTAPPLSLQPRDIVAPLRAKRSAPRAMFGLSQVARLACAAP